MAPDAPAIALADVIVLLERTPGVLNALLRGLPAQWAEVREGAGTFSPFDVVGHLVHGERTDWIPRALIIREHGDAMPFDPYDRFAQAREAEQTLDGRLDEFALLRAANLATLRGWSLTPADLGLRGRHPELGTVTLGQLMTTWAAHDLTHLHQLSRVLAHPLRTDVGPWQRYLGVLHCKGHSG